MPRRRLATASLGTLLLVGMAWPVSGHAFLVAASPPPGEAVRPPLEMLELRFVEPVMPSEVQLRGAPDNGILQEWRDLHRSEHFTLPVSATEPGEYTVEFEVVSGDGHIVDGQYRFWLASEAEPALSLEPTVDGSTAASAPITWIVLTIVAFASGLLAKAYVSSYRDDT